MIYGRGRALQKLLMALLLPLYTAFLTPADDGVLEMVVTVAGYGILAGTIYFYWRHYYPIPCEWSRLPKLAGATALSLATVDGLFLETGAETALPLGALAWHPAVALLGVPVLPHALLTSGFFTPGERQRLSETWRRLAGRSSARPAELDHDETGPDAAAALEMQAQIEAGEKGGVNQ